jgi:hypothetical protein
MNTASNAANILPFVPTSVIPYIMPSFYVSMKAISQSKSDDFTNSYTVGVVLGIAGWMGQYTAYNYAVNHNHSEALLLPIATNVGSALYEWGKNAKKRVEEKTSNPELKK